MVARIGLVVGGLVGLVVTPSFALAFYPAYGSEFGEPLPPWSEFVDWPVLFSGSDPVDTYNRHGIVFASALLVVVLSLTALIRTIHPDRVQTRRSGRVIVGGLGAVAVGSFLEYGFERYLDASFGFLLEALGFLAVIIGMILLGVSLRQEAGLGIPAAVAIGASGFVGTIIGIGLVGHLPSGPALIPLVTAVVIGFTGLPAAARQPIKRSTTET